MKKCPKCNNQLSKGSINCDKCGTNIRSTGKMLRIAAAGIILICGVLICGLGLIISFFIAIGDSDAWPVVIAFLIGIPASIITGMVLDGFGELMDNVRLIAEKIAPTNDTKTEN